MKKRNMVLDGKCACQEGISKLPFAHRGIQKDTIKKDAYGISYLLDDGTEIKCPPQGGVWLNDNQVVGTHDRPYRFIVQAFEEYKNKNKNKNESFEQ